MSIELNQLINSTLFKTTTDGLSGTGKLVYNGSTLSWEQDPVEPSTGYAYLESQTTQTLALTAATLTDSASYVPLTTATMWNESIKSNCTTSTANGSITVTYAGVYQVNFWINVGSNALNTSFGIKYDVNGVKSTSSIIGTSKDTSDTNNMSANGLVYLPAGAVIKIAIAADTTCTASIKSTGFSIVKIDNV